MKTKLLRIHWFLSSFFGIDPLRFLRSLRGIPTFFTDYRKFRHLYCGSLVLRPCLHDRYEEAGFTKSEYFWQDLIVARLIFESAPKKHVDVGSGVDGFVAHVASFREIEVYDIRPITNTIPNVIFRQADIMNTASLPIIEGKGYCDSLSCLHALEHFGLGRYGDPIDPHGYKKAIHNMATLLWRDGKLYLSTPIGKERVEFNANWVFDPRTIIKLAMDSGLKLIKLLVITPSKGPQEITIDDKTLSDLAKQQYNLGLFIFKKL